MDRLTRMGRRPTPPGTILTEMYLKPREVSLTAFAGAIGISRKHMSQIVNGHVRLEPEIAARIGKVLGTSAELWINLQARLDAYEAHQSVKDWTPTVTFRPAA
ncbi:HigA family addiction module antitoxin [Inquilinus sp. CAU 1745]|uniref:HigA family addiction module antitoxin n=1 Tax=Inquilinus sp. CAU 1745 TaxID=3140369 RepID=UPI00325BB3C3